MLIRIDAGQIPPAVELLDADDFESFKAVIAVPAHTWVAPSVLVELSPDFDTAWLEQLEKMVAFARDHGWTDEGGRIRAHLELIVDSDDAAPT